MLTALDALHHKIGGFEAGADDYLMVWGHNQPHVTCDPTGASETLPACPKAAFTGSQASAAVVKYDSLAKQAIAQDKAGDTAGSHATVQQMRDPWDADAAALDTPARDHEWRKLDDQMDVVLEAYGIDHKNSPFPSAEQVQRLSTLRSLLAASKL